MGGVGIEKEFEIRRLASKYTHELLTETGCFHDAKMVAALMLNTMLHPAPMPEPQKMAELIKLVAG